MNHIDTDAGDDWSAFLGVCEHMAGRKPNSYEIDRLYDCWLADETCQDATQRVLGVVFVGSLNGFPPNEPGLVHISTPLRTVDQMIRQARAEREIRQILADAVGRPLAGNTGAVFAPSVHHWPYVPDREPAVTGPSGWPVGRRAPLWWVLIGLAGAVGTGFLVATLAAVFH